MKLIGRAGGVAASRKAPEEYVPENPPPLQDLINTIQATYQFTTFPPLQPGININGPFAFGAGRFVHGDRTFAVTQLVMTTEGDMVTTISTEDSEIVLDHLMEMLDERFGFRLRKSGAKRSFLSTLVVEFDGAFSAYIDKIGKMETAINSFLPQGIDERRFKSLTFGRDFIGPQLDYIATIELADFQIDRRAGQPFSLNRFFCTAPMRTVDHIRALEQIEAIARG